MGENVKKKLSRRKFVNLSLLSTLGLTQSCSHGIRRKPSSLFSRFFQGSDERETLSSIGTDDIQSQYDMIVVGSGYGSSTVSALMAESNPNHSICVLEMGREFLPGDFPKNMRDVIGEVRGPLAPNGLLNQNLGFSDESDLDIISASGLGGTSLINAAISVRPVKKVFEMSQWPKAIRDLARQNSPFVLGGLEKYYLRAESALSANSNDEKIKSTRKSSVFEKAARKLNVGIGYLKLNIKYTANDTDERESCTMCGDCCSGCNVGAKNILPYNYLSRAKKAGCEIFTQTKVTVIKKEGELYTITVKDMSSILPSTKTITTKNLVIGAGSMGSTNLLLKANKSGEIKTSHKLGESLSLNADVLGFCYNGENKTSAVGVGTSRRKRAFQRNVGPGISTFANYREKNRDKDLEDQFLLLEGSIPSALTGVVASALAKYSLSKKDSIQFSDEQWSRVKLDNRLIPDKNELNPDGALNHSTLFLACGHDSSGGKYVLDAFGNIQVVYKDVVNEKFYDLITEKMKAVSHELGGYFLANPRTTIFNGKMMATHPLGGCPMGESHLDGVVNHKGQVFDRDGGIHKGLYVVDAAIIPRSLGATPLLTITALAERIAENMIKDEILD